MKTTKSDSVMNSKHEISKFRRYLPQVSGDNLLDTHNRRIKRVFIWNLDNCEYGEKSLTGRSRNDSGIPINCDSSTDWHSE